MNKNEVLIRLKEVKPRLEKQYGLTVVALFVSYSREEQHMQSDIDLLLDFSSVNASHFFNCSFELQDIFKDQKVEIVTKGGIKSKYFNAIKNDLIYA